MNGLETGEAFDRNLLRENVLLHRIFLPGEIPDLPIVTEPNGEIALMRMPWYDVIPKNEAEGGARKIKSVIHSDTLYELYSWLVSKKKILPHIMIEGRVLNAEQFNRLINNPVWKYMGYAGSRRAKQDELTDTLTFILPHGTTMSKKQILDLCEMKYGPKQSAEAIGARSAFFPADLLLEVCEVNAAGAALLISLLDGCNEFHIAWTGPRTILGLSARVLANEFATQWRKKEGYVSRKSVSTALTDDTIARIANIQNIRIKRGSL